MRSFCHMLLAVALVTLAKPLCAEPSSTDPTKVEARRHFQAGLALAGKGDFVDAVEAFEKAYATSPHFAVLYNLGQAYAALGRSERAVRTLEKFLADGGDKVEANRQTEVRELLARERARLGSAEIDVSPSDAEAFIDGASIGTGPFERLELAAGLHVIGARKSGYRPHAQVFELAPGGKVQLELTLEPELTVSALGLLGVRCGVPAVDVSVDGTRRTTTPLGRPLLVPIGTHTVQFTRDGYVSVTRTVTIAVDEITEVDCSVNPDPRGTKRGALAISSEPPASVLVDGKAHRGPWLPPGPHAVRVEREGFVPWTSIVTVEPARHREITVALRPTPERLREREAETRHQRTWAIGVGIGGLALAGASAATYVWNLNRYEEWRRERDRADAELGSGTTNPGAAAQLGELRDQATDIQRVDDLALGMAVAATAALVTSGILWVTSD